MTVLSTALVPYIARPVGMEFIRSEVSRGLFEGILTPARFLSNARPDSRLQVGVSDFDGFTDVTVIHAETGMSLMQFTTDRVTALFLQQPGDLILSGETVRIELKFLF